MRETPFVSEGSPEEADPDSGSIARATLIEVVGAVTLLNPTWSIIRHPFRFSRFRVNPGNAVHYLYASLGVVLIVTKWTDKGARTQDGGDAAPFIDLINRALAGLGLNARLEGADGLPVFLLTGNIIGGLTSYFVCRCLARRQGVAPLPAASRESTRSAQTLAANAYICGAAGIIYAIGLLFARGDPNALPLQAAVMTILFLVFCWGRWLQAIHGLKLGRVASVLFPFGLAFASVCAFAAVDLAIKVMLTSPAAPTG